MSKFWIIDWFGNLYFGSRFSNIPVTGTPGALAVENVEIKVDLFNVSLSQFEVEDVEIDMDVAEVTLMSHVYAEIVEIRTDDIAASLIVNSYGLPLAGDGMDRRAVA